MTIVIDDLGRSLDEVDRLLALEEPITFAVLPYEVRTAEVVAALRSHGAEYLCHLPMEAKGSADPGPGALELTMAHDELRATTRRALAAVPGAVGVNNHMGSGISSERRAIATVLGVIAEQGLSYLDSRTAADTVGFEVARQLGIPAAERHVFLDSDRSPESIRRQFETLLEQARQRGSAIAIGHPYPETLDVLQTELPRAREAGFVVVPLSHVLIDG
ncbi:MAG: divergent polysaccharide deacetylase family protein [Acidobacteriota bacterium]